MSWFSVSLEVPAHEVDGISDHLSELGAVSVSIRGADGKNDLVLEPAPGQTPMWDRNRLLALFPLDTDISELSTTLKTLLDAHVLGSLDVGFVDAEDWLEAWRPHAVQHLFGERLWIAPKDVQVPTAAKVLRLEPGMAFGTGGHPTTHMCLEWLARQHLDGLAVMDYGCGSGILAIAACLLGADAVCAADHDPQALLATKDNAAYNGISTRQLKVVAPEQLAGATQFDVVVANILANPLIELAPRLAAMIRPGGQLVLSGLLVEQASSVRAAYPGIEFGESATSETWIRLVGTKHPDV